MTKQTLTTRHIYYLYGVFVLIYAVLLPLAILNPSVLAQYNLSPLQASLILITLAIPILAVWFIAFYAYAKLKEYMSLIQDSKESMALNKITSGIGLLALYLPINSIISNLLRLAGRNWESFAPYGLLIKHYIGLLILLAAFIFIYRGAVSLISLKRRKVALRNKEWVLLTGFILVSAFFVYLNLAHPGSGLLGNPNSTNFQLLPDWLVIGTVVIPYLIVWFIGLFAAYLMFEHRSLIKGKIYGSFFSNMAIGITIVIIASIADQYIDALSDIVNALPFTFLLLLIYLLLLTRATGFILIAKSVQKLKKIEEA